VKKKIGVLALGAALAFGMAAGAWAQGGGARGGAAAAGAAGVSGAVGGRGAPNAPPPIAQSSETPVRRERRNAGRRKY
jgi:hypothetical protein